MIALDKPWVECLADATHVWRASDTEARDRHLGLHVGPWPADVPWGLRLIAEPPRPDPLADALVGMDSADLAVLDLPPLQQAIAGLLPEGLGVIGAPPKAGKSLLAYQMAVAMTHGGPLLGLDVERRPVLYYALEDGQRRSQARVKAARGSLPVARGLDLRWTAPRLGSGLEDEVARWLDEHERGVVIIDVLAKVRPSGKAGLNAYDEDYSILTELHNTCRRHPGSTILLITHDRKAGADDWMTRITGTRGVTGVADFVIFIGRNRTERVGTIYVTGRDIEDASYLAAFTGDGWQVATPSVVVSTKHPTRQAIFAWLLDDGPSTPLSIAQGTGLGHDVVKHRIVDMARDGDVIRLGDGMYGVSNED